MVLSAFLDLKGKGKGESVTTGHLIGSVTLGGMLQLAKRHAEEAREWLDVNLDTSSSLSLISCRSSQLANSNTNPKGSQLMQPLQARFPGTGAVWGKSGERICRTKWMMPSTLPFEI